MSTLKDALYRKSYTILLSDNERQEVLKALLAARERTPATGVSSADWLVKDALDHAKRELEDPKEDPKTITLLEERIRELESILPSESGESAKPA